MVGALLLVNAIYPYTGTSRAALQGSLYSGSLDLLIWTTCLTRGYIYVHFFYGESVVYTGPISSCIVYTCQGNTNIWRGTYIVRIDR
ncbi:hypothetical protein BDV41DRAFT_542297 [Aspergillus transmontanensis]|uniref:Uncharacterized protein n=1 Tax=Aspergillus transmontanensis TaxID=1034304 RepID=A0A5N6VSU1_9EURO|nr:hypothetical protein BDV41DRAFT_542297 [Aspergillus transmontanensis]